jgi:hypothetical protein
MLTVEQHLRNLAAIVASERFLYGKLESVACYLKVRCGFFGVTIVKSTGDEFDDHIYMCPGRGKTGLRSHPSTPYLSADPHDTVSVIGIPKCRDGVRQIADHLSTRREEFIRLFRGNFQLGAIAIELLQDQVLSDEENRLLREVANLLSRVLEPSVIVMEAEL